MTINQSTNTSAANNFIFLLSSNKLKDIEFRVQGFSGLGITLGEESRTWNSLAVNRPGDGMSFNELSLTILLDENLDIIDTLYEYLFRIKNYVENSIGTDDWTGILFTSTNRNNYSKKFIFENCWIKGFGDLSLTSTSTSAEPLTLEVNISFSYYTISDAE